MIAVTIRVKVCIVGEGGPDALEFEKKMSLPFIPAVGTKFVICHTGEDGDPDEFGIAGPVVREVIVDIQNANGAIGVIINLEVDTFFDDEDGVTKYPEYSAEFGKKLRDDGWVYLGLIPV